MALACALLPLRDHGVTLEGVPLFCLPEPLRVDENEDPTGVEYYIAQ